MSTTTIYRCDLCGDESTKALDWELGSEVCVRWGNHFGARVELTGSKGLDICPKCCERVKAEFCKAWEKVRA